jgi:hypothetical protein
LEGGWPKMAIFARGGHYPWVILALRVTGIVPLPLSDPSTQRFMPTFHQSSTYRPGGTPNSRWASRSLVGCAGAMAPEQFDLNMIERVDIGGVKFGKGGGVTSNRDVPGECCIFRPAASWLRPPLPVTVRLTRGIMTPPHPPCLR